MLLLDEPTDFLDSLTIDLIVAALKGKILEGKTIVATTHRSRISQIAHRTVRLKKRLP